MSQGVPHELFDLASLIVATRSQERCLAAERERFADAYLTEMVGHMSNWTPLSRLEALEAFKLVYGTGYAKRAAAYGIPDLRELRAEARGVCNDGDRRWRGTWPMQQSDMRPARGNWVVYQLLGSDGELLYIGSTGDLYARLAAHDKSGKRFAGWRAALCASERECRDLEAALIDRDRPPLNRMIATPRVAICT